MHQWYRYEGRANQQWVALDRGNGYWQLKAAHSGKCLTVYDGSIENGAYVSQQSCNNNSSQQFKPELRGDGYFFLRARHSDKCLRIPNYSKNNGVFIIQYSCEIEDLNKWSFTQIN